MSDTTNTPLDVKSGTGITTLSSSVTSAIIESGGILSMTSGGVVSSVTVEDGGKLFVGKAGDHTSEPGVQGTVSGGTVAAGGILTISGGGLIENTTVATNAFVVASGAAASNVTLSGSNVLESLYGTDSGTVILAGTKQDINDGGVASGATVSAGGNQLILAGGSAYGTIAYGVAGLAQESITNAGYISGAQLIGSGALLHADAGSADGTLLISGGSALIESGAIMNDTTVESGGVLFVHAGGNASGVVVESGGHISGAGGTTAAGATVANITNATVQSGGELDAINTTVSGATVESNGCLVAYHDSGYTPTIDAVTVQAGGTLELVQSDITVTNLTLASGGMLALDALKGADTPSVSVSGDTVTITATSNGTTLTQTLSFADTQGALTPEEFSSADWSDGVLTYVACYLLGTLIAVENEEVPVETLRIGDHVRTASGALRPIRWIGRRSYAPEFVASNSSLFPVLFRAGSLGEGLPRRDLRVSAMHAMFLNGVLVPAGALINGHSIVRDESIGEVNYFHIELDTHDVLLAEGAASESYVEDGARGIFQNFSEYYTLYPDASREWAVRCAPYVDEGETLRAIRAKLEEHASLLEMAEVMQEFEDDSRFQGWLDSVTHSRIEGWAWDARHPFDMACVEILVDGRSIATLSADRQRGDIARAGMGAGWAGFRLDLDEPLDWRCAHRIEVRHAVSKVPLSGSPKMLEPLEVLDEAMEHAITRAVKGLASRPERLRALSFMTEQVERLRAQEAECDMRRDEVEALGKARRRAGRAAASMPEIRRALVLAETLPCDGLSSEATTLLSHMRGLKRLGYDVTFAAVDQCVPAAMAAELDAEGVSVAQAPLYTSVDDLLRRQADGFEVMYLRGQSVALAYAGLARRYLPRARLLFALRSLRHLALARRAEVQQVPELGRAVAQLRTQELTTALLCDAVIVHSEMEATSLRTLAPMLNVHVAPWDVTGVPTSVDAAQRSGVAFLGHYGHMETLEAASWLVRDVMPRVWAQASHIRCVLAGEGPQDVVSALARAADETCGGVEVVGPVDNLSRDLFSAVRLGVASQRLGAGVAAKVVDTFAAGLPCVMTPVAAEGLSLSKRLETLVCGDANSMARRIVRLHDTPEKAEALGRSGQRMVQAAFTADAVASGLAAALNVTMPAVRLRA
ncbi:hypothetical protein AA0472_0438 [Acetobacter estunensis NRIC 0472]|nr:Hint domain-containing protein [Acetobacter estunensis]GBQ21401.1 hypothetical protein AA0472_0438 [Acetobacter estunensis NRIC 0472]